MSGTYEDRWITVDDGGVTIRGYYFPWGSKRIPFDRVRSVERVSLGLTRGRGRIWGTGNPSVWASLDPGRPRKEVGFLVSSGGPVRALITPDDADAAEQVLRAHLTEAIFPTATSRAPVV